MRKPASLIDMEKVDFLVIPEISRMSQIDISYIIKREKNEKLG